MRGCSMDDSVSVEEPSVNTVLLKLRPNVMLPVQVTLARPVEGHTGITSTEWVSQESFFVIYDSVMPVELNRLILLINPSAPNWAVHLISMSTK